MASAISSNEQNRPEMKLSDRELLEDCLKAFEAIPIAAASRKMLKHLGQQPVAYAGNGSHILARVMADELRHHLETKPAQ
jgi:hypothetical protein